MAGKPLQCLSFNIKCGHGDPQKYLERQLRLHRELHRLDIAGAIERQRNIGVKHIGEWRAIEREAQPDIRKMLLEALTQVRRGKEEIRKGAPNENVTCAPCPLSPAYIPKT